MIVQLGINRLALGHLRAKDIIVAGSGYIAEVTRVTKVDGALSVDITTFDGERRTITGPFATAIRTLQDTKNLEVLLNEPLLYVIRYR